MISTATVTNAIIGPAAASTESAATLLAANMPTVRPIRQQKQQLSHGVFVFVESASTRKQLYARQLMGHIAMSVTQFD